MTGNCKKAACP